MSEEEIIEQFGKLLSLRGFTNGTVKDYSKISIRHDLFSANGIYEILYINSVSHNKCSSCGIDGCEAVLVGRHWTGIGKLFR